jgi:hypothetical protein
MVRNFFSFLLIIFLSRCDDPGIPGTSVGSNLVIDIREHSYAGNRSIIIRAETERSYPCGPYSILHRNFQLGSHGLRIDFNGLSGGCHNNAVAPAITTIDMGDLPVGVHRLELNNGFMRNKGTVTISSTDIILAFGKTRGIKFSREAFKRVPLHTYWGEIISFSYTATPKVDEFLQKLVSMGAVFQKQPPGDYVYYKIDETGNIHRPEVDSYGNSRFIIFQFNGDETALKELIWYGERFNKGMYHINLNTYQGEQINNWSL